MRKLIASILLLLAGCGDLLGGVSRDEVAWAKSPDGRIHAILIETNGGATTSFGYQIELHPADHQGEQPVSAGRFYGATRSDCAYGTDMRWINASTLAFRLDKAEQTDVPPSVTVAGRVVKLVVQPGIKNADAPCGGMAFNKSMGK